MVKLCIILSSPLDSYNHFCSVYAYPLDLSRLFYIYAWISKFVTVVVLEKSHLKLSGMLKVKVTHDKNDKMVIN